MVWVGQGEVCEDEEAGTEDEENQRTKTLGAYPRSHPPSASAPLHHNTTPKATTSRSVLEKRVSVPSTRVSSPRMTRVSMRQ
jgi:hypothetical protein